MSWRQPTARDSCHDCKQPITGPVWQGEHTPMTWCEACAGVSLRKTLGDAQEVPRREVPGLTGMREFIAKFAPKVRANWGERE